MACVGQESQTERDRLRSEFVQHLNRGAPVSIETHVGRLPTAEQSDLLTELIRHDHAYRWQKGEPPDLVEYTARFPNHLAAVEKACFAKPAAGGVPYTLVSTLASGTQSNVHLARDNRHGRAVVVKVARRGSHRTAEHLRHEAGLLNRARHPRIVELVDYFERAGRPFLVLEYIAGTTLAAKL